MSSKHLIRNLILAVSITAFLYFFDGNVSAQAPPKPSPTPAASPSPSPTPEGIIVGNDEDAPSVIKPEPVKYVLPDLDPTRTIIDNKAFWFRLGWAALPDYTFVSQDDTSKIQSGEQKNTMWDLRAGRFIFAGFLKFKKPWTFLVGIDINEKPSTGHRQTFDLLDYSLTIPLWKSARITIGKQKEPFVYEMVGDAVFLPQQERILNPFFVSREVGVKYTDNFKDDRIFLSVGVFNTWEVEKVKFKDGGWHVAGRLTGLPIASKDGREYLHIGGAYRYYGDDQGTVRFKSRPESNVIDNYVDTGDIPAKHANEIAFETLYTKKQYSVLTEYVHSWVSSPTTQNPGFDGFYVTGSWMITGENRPYDRKVAYARRMVPKSRWGALEAIARYSYLDLDGGTVKGGKLNKVYFGLNWWASIQWKFGIGYGFSSLNKLDTVGHTHAVLLRAQWVY